jgi:hypothetical protein
MILENVRRKMNRTLLIVVMFVFGICVAAYGGGQPPKDEQIVEFGVRVEAPKIYEGYKIVIEEIDRKPETLEFELMFRTEQEGLEHFRYIINLNIFAENTEPPYDIIDIAEVASLGTEPLEIIVTVSISEYDFSKTQDPILLFWVPDGSFWENAENFVKDISELDRTKQYFSFKVLNWPIDDRVIACGG